MGGFFFDSEAVRTESSVVPAQVTQDQFWQLTCDLSTPGTQPYALCGLTTCSGLEDYPTVAACKCAPETVNEMFDLGVPLCRGAFTPSTRLVSIREGDGWSLVQI